MYCTEEDLNQRFGRERVANWGSDSDIICSIEDAAAEINGYLVSGGYPVPLQQVPAHIKKHAIDLSIYNILSAAGVLDQESAGDAAILDRAKAARKYLEGLARGILRLQQLPQSDDDTTAGNTAQVRGRTAANWDGMI